MGIGQEVGSNGPSVEGGVGPNVGGIGSPIETHLDSRADIDSGPALEERRLEIEGISNEEPILEDIEGERVPTDKGIEFGKKRGGKKKVTKTPFNPKEWVEFIQSMEEVEVAMAKGRKSTKRGSSRRGTKKTNTIPLKSLECMEFGRKVGLVFQDSSGAAVNGDNGEGTSRVRLGNGAVPI